jgi:hypothetical protein
MNAVATEALGEAIRHLRGLPRGRRCWLWREDGDTTGPGGEELLAYFGPMLEVRGLALLRLPEVGADKFVENLPRPAKGRLEKLATWSNGGCIPAPRRLEGIEWALALYGTGRRGGSCDHPVRPVDSLRSEREARARP